MATTVNKTEKIAEELVNLKVKEVQDLLKILKESYDIEPAAAAAPIVAAAAASGTVEEEKSEFDIQLKDYDQGAKMAIIKAVKAATGVGLIDAKKLVDAKDVIKKNVSKEEAEKIKKDLEAAGAKIELK